MQKEDIMNHVLDDYIFNNYVVIGVSAGPDSMCLLDLLQKKTTKIVVCHINHNVRKESIEDEKGFLATKISIYYQILSR